MQLHSLMFFLYYTFKINSRGESILLVKLLCASLVRYHGVLKADKSHKAAIIEFTMEISQIMLIYFRLCNCTVLCIMDSKETLEENKIFC